jgi:DNA-binding NarL/FixJ family response regulator
MHQPVAVIVGSTARDTRRTLAGMLRRCMRSDNIWLASDVEGVLQLLGMAGPTLALLDRDLPGGDILTTLPWHAWHIVCPHLVLVGDKLATGDLDAARASGFRGFVLRLDSLDETERVVREVLCGRTAYSRGVLASDPTVPIISRADPRNDAARDHRHSDHDTPQPPRDLPPQ